MTAIEQVVRALTVLTDQAVAVIYGVVDPPFIDAVHDAREALERWKDEQNQREKDE